MSWHSLISAASYGDQKKLAQLIQDRKFSTYVNKCDEMGFSPVHLAILHDHIESGLMLLDAGADPYAGVPGRSLLCTYIIAERLIWIKLFLWYNTHYEDVPFQHNLSKDLIEEWNSRVSRRHVLDSINNTLQCVKAYHLYSSQAEALLSKLNNKSISPIQQCEYLILAAQLFNKIFSLFQQEYLEVQAEEDEKQKWPKTYNTILNHYRKKMLSNLKKALECYNKIPLSNLNIEEKQQFIKTLNQIIEYSDDSEKVQYELQLANIYFTLSRQIQDSELKQDYLTKAQKIYEEKILTFSYTTAQLDLQITYFNTVAQFYLHLSDSSTDEMKHRYKEQALLLYKQLETICNSAQKHDQATAFTIMIKMLTACSTSESSFAAALSSSYPLRQVRNSDNVRHRKAANAEQAPLINSDKHGTLKSSFIKL